MNSELKIAAQICDLYYVSINKISSETAHSILSYSDAHAHSNDR